MFALQSSIRTQYVPSRIFWGYFRDILKLYWRYIYCLPSNKYYNKNYDYQSQNIQLNTYFKDIGNFGIGLGKKNPKQRIV